MSMKRTRCAVACVVVLAPLLCRSAEAPRFNPDTDPSRMNWTQIEKMLGPGPELHDKRFGVIVKTLTNEYWRLMAAGYRRRAAADHVKLDIQSAQGESDAAHQLAMMGTMVGSHYAGLLISPQSASNLQPAIDDAAAAGIPVVDVDGAVVDSVTHFVGGMNYLMGARVGQWFASNFKAGGQVAIIEGLPGVFSSVQRTAGFVDTLRAAKNFDVVASISGRWDRQLAYDNALGILRSSPGIVGIYCNNDTMALGVVDAVKSLNRLKRVHVFGTDGTQDAYASIAAGELTGTVDIFPMLAADIGLDIAERLAVGQRIPRVVETPFVLVTRENMARYRGSYEGVRRALLEDAAAQSPGR